MEKKTITVSHVLGFNFNGERKKIMLCSFRGAFARPSEPCCGSVNTPTREQEAEERKKERRADSNRVDSRSFIRLLWKSPCWSSSSLGTGAHISKVSVYIQTKYGKRGANKALENRHAKELKQETRVGRERNKRIFLLLFLTISSPAERKTAGEIHKKLPPFAKQEETKMNN